MKTICLFLLFASIFNSQVEGKRENWHKTVFRKGHHLSSRSDYDNEISHSYPRRNWYGGEPPDHTQVIAMARYVIHNAGWASVATISTLPAIEGFPFSNVKSMADGSSVNSTGIPYFYISPLDFTARDLTQNTRSTVLASLEETKFCQDKKYDPEDPRCTRVMLSGKIKKVRVNSTEYIFAKAGLFERHPDMANYPADHDFFVAKLKIAQIAIVDWFGGAQYIKVRDYLSFNFTDSEHVKSLGKRMESVVV